MLTLLDEKSLTTHSVRDPFKDCVFDPLKISDVRFRGSEDLGV